jgi:hypothetical protein
MGDEGQQGPIPGGGGWHRYLSPEGHAYYHHPLSGETQWQMPAAVVCALRREEEEADQRRRQPATAAAEEPAGAAVELPSPGGAGEGEGAIATSDGGRGGRPPARTASGVCGRELPSQPSSSSSSSQQQRQQQQQTPLRTASWTEEALGVRASDLRGVIDVRHRAVFILIPPSLPRRRWLAGTSVKMVVMCDV